MGGDLTAVSAPDVGSTLTALVPLYAVPDERAGTPPS
jgi:hypothetical protein